MTDFKALMKTLSDRGWTATRISKKFQLNRSTLAALACGQNDTPNYDLGKLLVDFERRTRPRS